MNNKHTLNKKQNHIINTWLEQQNLNCKRCSPTFKHILYILKTQGEQTGPELERLTQRAHSTVHEQLSTLENEDLIEKYPNLVEGRGRPANLWRIKI